MNFSFDHTILLKNFLSPKEVFLVFFDFKVWEFPVNDSRKPNESTYIIKFYRYIGLSFLNNVKSIVYEFLSGNTQISFRKGKLDIA